MAKSKQKHPDEDKEYVISAVSRADVRMIMGDEVADRLSTTQIERLAHEMSEYAMQSYPDEMAEIIEYKFSDDENDGQDEKDQD